MELCFQLDNKKISNDRLCYRVSYSNMFVRLSKAPNIDCMVVNISASGIAFSVPSLVYNMEGREESEKKKLFARNDLLEFSLFINGRKYLSRLVGQIVRINNDLVDTLCACKMQLFDTQQKRIDYLVLELQKYEVICKRFTENSKEVSNFKSDLNKLIEKYAH